MVYRKRILAAFLFSLFVTSVAGSAAAADEATSRATALMEKAAANFDRIQTIRASIDQVLSARGGGQRFQGVYVAAAPARFHIEYQYPYRQQVVSNGNELWWYIPQSKKVWFSNGVTSLTNSPEAMGGQTFGSLGFENIDLAPQSDVVYKLEDSLLSQLRGKWKIEFEGTGSAQGMRGTFWLDRKSGLPLVIEIRDDKGEVTLRQTFEDYELVNQVSVPTNVLIEVPRYKVSIQVRYADIKINQPVDDREFRFAPPAGVPVVPLTSAM